MQLARVFITSFIFVFPKIKAGIMMSTMIFPVFHDVYDDDLSVEVSEKTQGNSVVEHSSEAKTNLETESINLGCNSNLTFDANDFDKIVFENIENKSTSNSCLLNIDDAYPSENVLKAAQISFQDVLCNTKEYHELRQNLSNESSNTECDSTVSIQHLLPLENPICNRKYSLYYPPSFLKMDNKKDVGENSCNCEFYEVVCEHPCIKNTYISYSAKLGLNNLGLLPYTCNSKNYLQANN